MPRTSDTGEDTVANASADTDTNATEEDWNADGHQNNKKQAYQDNDHNILPMCSSVPTNGGRERKR